MSSELLSTQSLVSQPGMLGLFEGAQKPHECHFYCDSMLWSVPIAAQALLPIAAVPVRLPPEGGESRTRDSAYGGSSKHGSGAHGQTAADDCDPHAQLQAALH